MDDRATVPSLAIIVATRDRAASLARLLGSALAMEDFGRLTPQLVVADNGSHDDTARTVAAVAADAAHVRVLSIPSGGKTHALNVAIRSTVADVLAFVDDDVTFDPQWLVAATRYFARAPVGAAQGTIRVAPEATRDPALARAVARWRTIPSYDLGPGVTAARSLVGANMFVTRSTFARVGLFDERLGPGAAGASEDTELARRISAAGASIGYIADAVVYHAVDRERLSAEYFRKLHTRLGQSRVYYKRTGLAASILPNLALAALQMGWTRLAGRPEPRRRALARWYHYRAMLAARRSPRLPGGVPRLHDA